MNQEITKLLENSLIEKSKSDYIIEKFSEFTSIATEWNEKANAIVVTEESQTDLMKQAREGRLLLKAKRIEIEKTRKSLKEQSLNEGRLIDSIAKTLTALVEPAEKHLELQERFAEIQDQKRKAELKAKRYELILPYAEVIDPETLNLGLITEEAFAGILKYAKDTLEAKLETERLAKIKQEEKAKAEAEEKEKLRLENEKLKAEALEHSKAVMQKQKEASELKAKADELLAKKNAELKAISDKMKEQEIVIEKIVEKEETQKDELTILKEKYAIAKTTLEAVLWYIVPDDCRTMVYKALDELNDKKPK
jgi:hypothetical protein